MPDHRQCFYNKWTSNFGQDWRLILPCLGLLVSIMLVQEISKLPLIYLYISVSQILYCSMNNMSIKLPLTKQVEESFVDVFIFKVLWGHQDFLKQSHQEETLKAQLFLIQVLPLHKLIACIFIESDIFYLAGISASFYLFSCTLSHCLLGKSLSLNS